MGNWLGKKRVITEELENLTLQMKGYKQDIEQTSESRRMLLWYLTLLNFFLSTSICAYAWFHFDEKQYKIIVGVSGFIAGFLLLWISRKLVNAYYEWRLKHKRRALEDLFKKKKTILDTVKETETFKVATEILEKYDEAPIENPPVRPASQPNTPATARRGSIPPPGTPIGPPQNLRIRGPPQGSGGPKMGSPPGTQGTPQGQLQNMPMSAQMMMASTPNVRPARPFHQEPQSVVYKLVDYFFSDGPSNRMALICSNCHGHNGMALPEEYEYMAFVCFICKHFNPAKKLKPAPMMPPPPQFRPNSEPNQETTEGKHDEENKEKESPLSKSENGTEDEFDVVPSQQSSTDDEDTPK